MRSTVERAFTFVEMMFAVVVLGIGMIGLAAALSVGALTVQSTVDESTAARVAASAYAILSSSMTLANATSCNSYQGIDFSKPLQDALKRQLILATDHRYAWIPFYLRPDDDTKIAQVIVVAVRCESGGEYTSADFDPKHPDPTSFNPATLFARSMSVDAEADPNGGPDVITFTGTTQVVAPGTIVVTKSADGTMPAGRILKVNELLNAKKKIWSLAPGYDLQGGGAYTGAAFVVGRPYRDPNTPAAGFSGGSQALAAYAMMIQLH